MNHIIYDREAHHPPLNIHRFYRVWLETNLFKTLLVCAQYGRVGTRGHVKEYPVVDEAETKNVVSSLLEAESGRRKAIRCGIHHPLMYSNGALDWGDKN